MSYVLTTDERGLGQTFSYGDGTETREQRIDRLVRTGLVARGCAGCAEFLAAPDPVEVFAPSHRASPRCQSGQRPHCTCDTCF